MFKRTWNDRLRISCKNYSKMKFKIRTLNNIYLKVVLTSHFRKLTVTSHVGTELA